jgi:alkanesulfonate monooxygenase SsuD/methylene tetrahydromethanopterin reductase-like flavin-dependent oxidoreductase (luciferase family)
MTTSGESALIPLRLGVLRARDDLPLYLAGVGPRSLELVGELADGWLASACSYAPEHADARLEHLRRGRQRVGASLDGFDIAVSVPVVVSDDLEAAADQVRLFLAYNIGAKTNFNELAPMMGHEEAARAVRERFLAGDPEGAAALVPFRLIDATCLLGPVPRLADRLHAFAVGRDGRTAVTSARDAEGRVEVLQDVVEAMALADV